jgi:hypothetical protein
MAKTKVLTKFTKGGKDYYSLEYFMVHHGIKTKKTVYDWLAQGIAEKMKIGSASFFHKR